MCCMTQYSRAPEMLARTYPETEYRLEVCCATNGAHIEIC